MRRTIFTALLCGVILIFFSCNNNDEFRYGPGVEGPRVINGIENYAENVKGVAFFASSNDEIPFQMDVNTIIGINYDESSEYYARYWGLSYAYGDTVYPGYVMTRPVRYALADTLSGISIITKKDFDEQHPAGSSINDILDLTYLTYKDAIADRWAKERERTPGLYDRDIDYIKSIPLSSFTPEDGVLLRMERMSLDVKKYPAKKGEYPLALKFTFNNGAYTYENTITYTFE